MAYALLVGKGVQEFAVPLRRLALDGVQRHDFSWPMAEPAGESRRGPSFRCADESRSVERFCDEENAKAIVGGLRIARKAVMRSAIL